METFSMPKYLVGRSGSGRGGCRSRQEAQALTERVSRYQFCRFAGKTQSAGEWQRYQEMTVGVYVESSPGKSKR